MLSSAPLRLVDRKNDILYRKVDPDFLDEASNELKPTAFTDPGKPYEGASFFVKRFKSPEQVLRYFSSQGATKRIVGISSSVPPLRMFAHGFRVAAISAATICEIEAQYQIILAYKKDDDGNEIDTKGHVSLLNARQYAILLRRHARCLSEEDTFGNI